MVPSTSPSSLTETDLAAITIRDLIEIEPRAMEILAPYGIDLCCGGGHPLGEALDLHGVDRDDVIVRIADLIAGDRA